MIVILVLYAMLQFIASVVTALMDWSPLDALKTRTIGRLLFSLCFGPGIFLGKTFAKILRIEY